MSDHKINPECPKYLKANIEYRRENRISQKNSSYERNQKSQDPDNENILFCESI